MKLRELIVLYKCKKIRQLNWPFNTYFVPVEKDWGDRISGFIYWSDKMAPYDFYFDGISRWEELL